MSVWPERRFHLPAGVELAGDALLRRRPLAALQVPAAVLSGFVAVAGGAAVGAAAAAAGCDVGALGRFCQRAAQVGLLADVPDRDGVPLPVTVAIVVRDRTAELARCLEAVQCLHPGPDAVLVVDDASAEDVASVAAAAGARCVRHAEHAGVAAGRNLALAEAATPLVAFTDSDCEPDPGWLGVLCAPFRDPGVGAVGGRVRAARHESRGGRFEAVAGPLDMGAVDRDLAPGGVLTYAPTANLAVRRDAALAVGGFDAALTHGEDVDLCWRLLDGGWRIPYRAAAEVAHHYPTDVAAILRTRSAYAASEAALARRHPGRRRTLVVDPWPAALLLAVALGRSRRRAGIALVLLGAALDGGRHVAQALVGALPLSGGDVAGSAARHLVAQPVHLARHLRRYHLVQLALLGRPGRRVALAVACLAWLGERPARDPVLATAADVAYQAGVVTGCLRQREWRPLVPRFATTFKRLIRRSVQ